MVPLMMLAQSVVAGGAGSAVAALHIRRSVEQHTLHFGAQLRLASLCCNQYCIAVVNFLKNIEECIVEAWDERCLVGDDDVDVHCTHERDCEKQVVPDYPWPMGYL